MNQPQILINFKEKVSQSQILIILAHSSQNEAEKQQQMPLTVLCSQQTQDRT